MAGIGNERGWRAGAVCAGVDPELFFPLPLDEATQGVARRLYASCPVQPQCLAEGLADLRLVGVWGGLGEQERRRLAGGSPGELCAARVGAGGRGHAGPLAPCGGCAGLFCAAHRLPTRAVRRCWTCAAAHAARCESGRGQVA